MSDVTPAQHWQSQYKRRMHNRRIKHTGFWLSGGLPQLMIAPRWRNGRFIIEYGWMPKSNHRRVSCLSTLK